MKRILWLLSIGVAALAAGYYGFPSLFSHLLGQSSAEVVAGHERVRNAAPGKKIEERVIELTATPQIQSGPYGYKLVLTPAEGGPLEIHFDPGYCRWKASVTPPRPLHFSILQTKVMTRHSSPGEENFFWISNVETISEGSQLLYDARICPLHATRMDRREVDIHYGLPATEFFEAFEQFSGGPGFTLGGCNVEPERKAMDYVCEKCVEAYQTWEREFMARQKPRATAGASEKKS